MAVLDRDVERLLVMLTEVNPQWRDWSGGWPGELELALIDAVLSIRATYGGSATGVRAAIDRYRDWRALEHGDLGVLDDLSLLAAVEPDRLMAVLRNRQRTMGGTKAEAIVVAAKALQAAGVESSFDLDPGSQQQRDAYCSILGLGEISWKYLGLVLGRPCEDIIDASCSVVVAASGRPVTLERAEQIISAAALREDVSPLTIHRACWNASRRTGAVA